MMLLLLLFLICGFVPCGAFQDDLPFQPPEKTVELDEQVEHIMHQAGALNMEDWVM